MTGIQTETIFHARRVVGDLLTETEKVGNNGGLTIVLLGYKSIPDDMSEQKTDTHFVGYARCSLLDNYNKKLGREIACGRANKAAAWYTPKVKFGSNARITEINKETILKIIKQALFDARIDYGVFIGDRHFNLIDKVGAGFPKTMEEAELEMHEEEEIV